MCETICKKGILILRIAHVSSNLPLSCNKFRACVNFVYKCLCYLTMSLWWQNPACGLAFSQQHELLWVHITDGAKNGCIRTLG